MKFLTNKLYLLGILFLWGMLPLFSQTQLIWDEDGLPAVPQFQTSVYDYANIIPDDQEKFLEEKLIRYSDTTSTQIVIATVPELKGHDINLFAAEWAHKWGIGQEGKDNGIFILVAPNERKVAISTGYGVESRLTDALSRRLIENYMIPYFRQGDYFGGLNAGTDAIFKVLTGTFRAEPQAQEVDFWTILIILLIIFFVIWLLSRSSHGSSGGRGYTIDYPGGPIIWGGSSGSGGFGGGFGGGGGFSGGFGGGGFGGGGASGSW